MAIWSTTKQDIVNRIETLIRSLRGKETITYGERQVISDAINTALIDVTLDYGVEHWRFLRSETTATTVVGQNFVDLAANIFKVVAGTVRIRTFALAPKTIETI